MVMLSKGRLIVRTETLRLQRSGVSTGDRSRPPPDLKKVLGTVVEKWSLRKRPPARTTAANAILDLRILVILPSFRNEGTVAPHRSSFVATQESPRNE